MTPDLDLGPHPSMFDLVLRGQRRLSGVLADEQQLPAALPKLLSLALAGLLVHGAVVGLAARSFRSCAESGWFSHGTAWAWIPLSLVGAQLGALCICLPSFYFYTQLSGLDASFRLVTAQAVRAQATTAVLLLGSLPFYAAWVLLIAAVAPASREGLLDPSAAALVGLALPFLVGLFGIRQVYKGFTDLLEIIPITHKRRGRFLTRMVLAWGAVYAAVAIVGLWRLSDALSRILADEGGCAVGIFETAVIYGLVGVVVGSALALRAEGSTPARRALLGLGAVVFWPLFAGIVLAGQSPRADSVPSAKGGLDARIRRAEQQLVAALAKVEGFAESIVSPEITRVKSLAGAMASMEKRLREMDELLRTAEFDPRAAQAALDALLGRGVEEVDPRVGSVRSRLRNIERLKTMRERTADDLERIVLKLEEMSSQLGLLKFAGKSDADLVRMIKDIADSIEEVTAGLLEASERPASGRESAAASRLGPPGG